MSPSPVDPARRADVVLVLMIALSVVVLLPWETASDVALGLLAATLIAWPLGLLLALARRWARAGDLRFVLLALTLAATATGSAVLAISLPG